MTEQAQIRNGDIVFREADAARKQPRGIVLNRFEIREPSMAWLRATPIEPRWYAVVIWHGRMRPRVERADELKAIGNVNDPN